MLPRPRSSLVKTVHGARISETNWSHDKIMIACMSQMANSHRAWPRETGVTSAQPLAKHLKGVVSPIYYISGPPAMVQAMRTLFTDMGVDDDNFRNEEFGGY
jgi:ferredoxin-NADP reductase